MGKRHRIEQEAKGKRVAQTDSRMNGKASNKMELKLLIQSTTLSINSLFFNAFSLLQYPVIYVFHLSFKDSLNYKGPSSLLVDAANAETEIKKKKERKILFMKTMVDYLN